MEKEENNYTNISINTNENNNKNKILELKNELEKNKKVLKSYEIQNLKLSENERKLKTKLVKELKMMNQKDIKYKNEIGFLKQKINSYEKKLSIILGEDYSINKNNLFESNQVQYSSNSNIKRSYSNVSKDPTNNIQTNNSNIKSSKAFLNNKNNIPISNISNNKYIFIIII